MASGKEITYVWAFKDHCEKPMSTPSSDPLNSARRISPRLRNSTHPNVGQKGTLVFLLEHFQGLHASSDTSCEANSGGSGPDEHGKKRRWTHTHDM